MDNGILILLFVNFQHQLIEMKNQPTINVQEQEILLKKKNVRLGSVKRNPSTETFFDYLIQNAEKLITLFLVIYFAFLIINLATCKHSLITYYLFSNASVQQTDNFGENIGRLSTGKEELPQIQFQIIDNQKEKKGLQGVFTQETIQQKIEISKAPFQTQAEINRQFKKTLKNKSDSQRNQQKNKKKLQNQSPIENLLQTDQQNLKHAKIPPNKQQTENFLLNEQQRQKILQKYKSILSNYEAHIETTSQKSISIQRNEIVSNYIASHLEQFQENLLLSLENNQIKQRSSKLDKTQKQKITDKYNAKHYTEQNSFCIVVTTKDNTSDQQFKRTLFSIFNQYYKKFEVIISDRSKQAKYSQLATQTLQSSYELDDFLIISKRPQLSQIQATYLALKQCKIGNVAILMDSNSELLGRYILRLLDINYSQSKSAVIYSDSFIMNTVTRSISKKTASPYDQSEMFMNLYRDIPQRFGKLFSFKYDLLQSLPTSMLINSDQQWFSHTNNQALIMPLLQLSCSKSTHINEPLVFIQQNEIETSQQKQAAKQQRKAFNRKNKLDFC